MYQVNITKELNAQGADFIFVNPFVYDTLQKLKDENAPQRAQTCPWPVFATDTLSSTVLKSFLPGSQEAFSFTEISSTTKVNRLDTNQVAGFRAGSSTRTFLDKNKRLPVIVPLGANVTEVTEKGPGVPETVTVSKTVAGYHLKDGTFSVNFLKQKPVTFPSDKQYQILVTIPHKIQTAYFGQLVNGFILQIRDGIVFILLPGSMNWSNLPGTAHVSGYHNGILDKSSTQILSFRTAAEAAKIFSTVSVYFAYIRQKS